MIGAAETGSGKTLAFGLPILNDILTRRDAVAAAEAEDATRVASESANGQEKKNGLQALVLCPTRELALQVAAHFREVVRDTGLAVVVSVRGEKRIQHIDMLAHAQRLCLLHSNIIVMTCQRGGRVRVRLMMIISYPPVAVGTPPS